MQPLVKTALPCLLVEPTCEAQNGEVAAANISRSICRKLLCNPTDREFGLTSPNKFYKDIAINGDELEMLKIMGVVRKVVPLGALAL